MEEKNLICICCPLGCPLTVALENGEVVSVTGNTCPRGADIYVDLISKKPVAIFTKKKVRMRAGETEKSISVKDPALFEVIEKTVSALSLAGPIDMDIFRIDGKYYISEINPRFGGGYPHAWHCNVRFPELIAKNLLGEENEPQIGAYEADMCMMKYSDEIVRKL